MNSERNLTVVNAYVRAGLRNQISEAGHGAAQTRVFSGGAPGQTQMAATNGRRRSWVLKLTQLLRLRRDESANRSAQPEHIPVVAVIPAGDHANSFEQVVAGSRWRVVPVRSCEEAMAAVRHYSAPVVIYDREVPGADWREHVRNMRASAHPVCLILVSRVADAYLWDAVIECGGFDVITKPFRREQVLRALEFAFAHWKTGWDHQRAGSAQARFT